MKLYINLDFIFFCRTPGGPDWLQGWKLHPSKPHRVLPGGFWRWAATGIYVFYLEHQFEIYIIFEKLKLWHSESMVIKNFESIFEMNWIETVNDKCRYSLCDDGGQVLFWQTMGNEQDTVYQMWTETDHLNLILQTFLLEVYDSLTGQLRTKVTNDEPRFEISNFKDEPAPGINSETNGNL